MMVSRTIPEGPFTWSMIEQTGVTRELLTTWLDQGDVRRVLQGVYQRSDTTDDHFTRARAATLVMKPFGILCDRTASWVHGVDTFDYRELEILPPLEMWVLRDHSRVRRKGCVGGERDLAPEDVMVISGVRLTTPLRTALDLGCRLGRRDALAALDGFMRENGICHKELRAQLPRYRRRRGVVQLRRLVALADKLSESPGESWTRLCILDDGLPPPELQHWVCEGTREIFRLDLAYPKHRVAIEYDGRDYHDSPEQRRRDNERRAWLRARGWTIIVVDKDSFDGDALRAWLTELRRAVRL